MADGAGCGVDFFHIGGDILLDLFCYLFVLDRVGPGSKDIMEELEGFISFQKIRGHVKGLLEALLVVMKA